MPLYHTKHENNLIGIYKGQRPSTAACKAMTALRRKAPIDNAIIHVLTEGSRRQYVFEVKYAYVQDDLLGLRLRPVASIYSIKIN